MKVRRNCAVVITAILTVIPEDKTDLITDLKWNRKDASYKAPEDNLQWERTMATLQKHIPYPKEDWEFEVISIFTSQPVEDLKAEM